MNAFYKPPKSHDNLTFGVKFLTTISKSSILVTFGGSKMITLKSVFQGYFWQPNKSNENLTFRGKFSKIASKV